MTLSTGSPAPQSSVRLAIYRMAAALSGPFLRVFLNWRARRGKEDKTRIAERFGHANHPRPEGQLLWVHGASVGESLSALPIIERLQAAYPGLHVVVTTHTLTSARLMKERLGKRAFHQFAPVDHPAAVRRFLEHWKPDLVFFMESELWPNLIGEVRRRKIGLVLLNARMSERSFEGWLGAKRMARALLSAFDLCLAQDTAIGGRLESLGARNVAVTGNLKYAAAPLPANEEALEAARQLLAGRKLWLAASTHEGEERAAGHVHASLKEDFSTVLTLIVPRHPERGPEIAEMLADMGLNAALRSRGDPIMRETDVYVADTIGELGIFYRLVDLVFMGGSLIPHGGQNPLEPARLHSAIVHGPHTENFFVIYRELAAAGAALSVPSTDQLKREVRRLLLAPDETGRMAEAGLKICSKADGVVARTMSELDPLLSKCLGRASGAQPERPN